MENSLIVWLGVGAMYLIGYGLLEIAEALK